LNVEYFLELCEKGEPFLYLDCDVMVLQDPTQDLVNLQSINNFDLLAQLDKRVLGFPQICTGIMYIQPTARVFSMFRWALKNLDKYKNDQKAINRFLITQGINWNYLPKTYYSINYDNGNKVWDGGKLKIKKRDYKMFHLNWTIGIKNKLGLWKRIKEE